MISDFMARSTITINGIKIDYNDGCIKISNGCVIIGGKEIISNTTNVKIEGNVGDILCDGQVTVNGEVKGNVDAGGSVSCGNVTGSVDAGGSVSALNINGDIDAVGSVHVTKK